jgi:hypothetical protein
MKKIAKEKFENNLNNCLLNNFKPQNILENHEDVNQV